MEEVILSGKARSLLKFIADSGYVCPQGTAWNSLWKRLPQKVQQGAGWTPALPLVLSGWYASDDEEKSVRLREHIAWADQYGVIDQIDLYLRTLGPDQWHKMGGEEISIISQSPITKMPQGSDGPSDPSSVQSTPPSKLAQAGDRIRAKLNASGFTERVMEPSTTTQLQATFVPARNAQTTMPGSSPSTSQTASPRPESEPTE